MVGPRSLFLVVRAIGFVEFVATLRVAFVRCQECHWYGANRDFFAAQRGLAARSLKFVRGRFRPEDEKVELGVKTCGLSISPMKSPADPCGIRTQFRNLA